MDDRIIYTNGNQCGRIPTQEEIFSRIRQGAASKDGINSGACGESGCG